MRILGVSAFYHDSAAALIENGRIVAAAQEERFSRKKHDASFPVQAVGYCLQEARCQLKDVDMVAFYEKPLRKFDRLVKTYLTFAPRGYPSFAQAAGVWLGGKLKHQKLFEAALVEHLDGVDLASKLVFAEHHQSHAASAFYPSPFEDAAVLTLDGVGEWTTTSLGVGTGNQLELIKEIRFPHSLGLLYSAFTAYTGFKVNSGEYKLMGLAPYGEPKYSQLILDNLVDVKTDGSFRLNLDYFEFCTGLRMTNKQFDDLFGGSARSSNSNLEQRHMDVAASIQSVTEEIILRLVRGAKNEIASRNLCLAGGVALNCVANGKILREGQFENIWIQPAAGDAGGALGAALVTHHRYLENPRHCDGRNDGMQGAYLGPEYTQDEIEFRLTSIGARFERLDEKVLLDRTVDALVSGMAVGWFQGRMEYGPRALGNRSIIADPRSPSMQRTLNLRVKNRESFRPFAPSVLAEDVGDWFEIDTDSPYMLLVAEILKDRRLPISAEQQNLFGIDKLNIARSEIPAVTHVDYSARLHTVSQHRNPRFHALLSAFKEHTGCPVLVNTSFNVRGEPIVCSPEDAFNCFMGTEIELLVMGNCMLSKQAQYALPQSSLMEEREGQVQ